MFNSDASQDAFVANLLHFKKNGYYVDIGSCGSRDSNNSFFFDSNLSWKGICIEIENSYQDTYHNRQNCSLINADATKIDYNDLFSSQGSPSVIDYLSIDVDTLSVEVLKLMPFDKYKFKVITIEHDSYLYGDKYKNLQREILTDQGYRLLCSDVMVEQPGYYGQALSFEDWWINPLYFDDNTLERIQSSNLYPSQILVKFE